ncbi:MAG TPA: CoA transferase [Thermoanaerobaculia bacterium]|nr:CoA transferase [Thermoanaerobaculia bacterium]
MLLLDGLRVLDFSRVLAGPLATQILGDLGAEVLKVEPPGGDETRRWGPPFQGETAAYFHSANRNKASLVLDLRQARGQERARQLIAVADVVVDNYRPATRRRLGLSAAELHRLRPDLVAVSITGFRGSREDEAAYDLVLQAESGFMGMTGPVAGQPHRVGVAVVDVLTGMMAANAVLAALVRRGRTGAGAALSVSLLQTALFSLVNVATNHLASGEPTRRWGNDHPNLVPYGAFRLADGPVVIAVGSDEQFRRLLAVLGVADSALAALGNAERVRRRREVVAVLQSALSSRRRDELLAALAAADVPAAPVLRPDEALARARRCDGSAVLALAHPRLGVVEVPDNPIAGEGSRQHHRAPPLLGEGGEDLARRWLEPTSGNRRL